MIDQTAILDARILIVDDLEVNVKLLARILGSAKYRCVSSTMDPGAVCSLHRRHRYDLIVLDLLMPDMDGFQVMEGLKEIEPDGYLPVLVISAQPGHKLRALKAGARDFISKPFELPEVLARVHNQLEMHLMHKELRDFNGILEQRVADRTRALKDSYLETIFTMTRAAEHKDEDLGSHVQRISHYSRALAVQLGLDKEFVDLIFFASPMHDIGKIGIPDQLLLKPGALTPDEWEIMKRHTTMGARILGQGTSPYLRMGAEIARSHHERWDGGGYPHGTRGEAIPLAARIMNICDIYDALRSKRPYKPAFDHHQACEIIIRGDNRIQPEHFDPAILAAFTQHQQVFGDIFEECTT
ncbi:HD domain-containing phosphohydrolase [Candidatus Thiodictyon syntrophicum]|jgi:putative two-component system response regulator|uniref:Two-component system response regulator n=1 Tax=Candidatus Thiodictyon syntrophicum TaxID=1166950 RepID=A0A2K8U8T1_9GAMM|nr:HD domain-containing phosphohydrolase [Candidatus Thiodictyon syntrophicum]AUB81964.1 two-component system response regulator [Candidatus Thiodictyon syntrophicum]